MWWIVLAMTAASAPNARPDAPPATAVRQAIATVRIVNPASVKLGKAATVRHELTIRATDARFRDKDGREYPARIVEFP